MRPGIQVLLSGAPSFGVPLLLAVREPPVPGRERAAPAAGEVPGAGLVAPRPSQVEPARRTSVLEPA